MKPGRFCVVRRSDGAIATVDLPKGASLALVKRYLLLQRQAADPQATEETKTALRKCEAALTPSEAELIGSIIEACADSAAKAKGEADPTPEAG